MAELGNEISQRYLRSTDRLVGIIGDAGSGKSMMIRGMFPGLELTNDDDGVNIRPLPILDLLDDPLGSYGFASGKSFGLFSTPHTYHLDIRFEMGFTSSSKLAQAIIMAIEQGKRVVVEHFELIYPLLKMEGSDHPINADLLIGVGEEVLVTRPNIFGPLPDDIAKIVHHSIQFRRMAHSAEDITEFFLDNAGEDEYEHADVRHGFVLCFKEKPMLDVKKLEKKIQAVIDQDLPICFHDDDHIKIGDEIKVCTGPRNHVRSTGEIKGFMLLDRIPYDPVRKCYLLIGLVGQDGGKHPIFDLDRLDSLH